MMYDLKSNSGFSKMYDEYYPKIYNYVYYRLLHRQNTEDLVSEIFIKVVTKCDTYDESKAMFSTWIYRIAQNSLIDFYRARKVNENIDDYEFLISDDSEDKFSDLENDYTKTVRILLAELTEDERSLVYMKYYEDMKNKQIAEILDMNESTVSTKFSRIMKKLRTVAAQKNISLEL